jgi:hypothetical protein
MPAGISADAADEPYDDHDEDPIEQFSDNDSHEDFYDSDADDTASADSLPGYDDATDSDNDGGLFDHRRVRVSGLFESYVAPSAHDFESDSHATTLHYVFEGPPDDPVPYDTCRG